MIEERETPQHWAPSRGSVSRGREALGGRRAGGACSATRRGGRYARCVEGSTRDDDYAARLMRLEQARWKRWLHVQAPYRWNLRRLRPGFVLDVGCGVGRNLGHLDGNGVGVDHNPAMVAEARRRGFDAYTPAEFESSSEAVAARFDTVLFAHVLEHMSSTQARRLIEAYLGYLRRPGRVIAITPQERGYASDDTHVSYVDDAALAELFRLCGVSVDNSYSFPLPRWAGTWFPYNEFVVIGRLS